MPIQRIFSFLVHPSKHAEHQPAISGTEVTRAAAQIKLHAMLTAVFDKAHDECDIEIVFVPDELGRQLNPCHELLVIFSNRPTLPNGRRIAARLQSASTNRSGLGLLFLMKGRSGPRHQLVISRFPADQGVIAHEHADELSVEFIERVFMKSAKAYKSALYESDAPDRGFWEGNAVDRQISDPRELSDYWIKDFLASDLRTTGPAGTRRLAVALSNAIRRVPTLAQREELIAAASLLRGQHGRRRSARQFIDRLELSEESARAVENEFPRATLMDEVFQFDREEFIRNAPYRAVELDNGGVLIAEDDKFADVFRAQVVDEADRRVRYITEGRVIDEALRRRK